MFFFYFYNFQAVKKLNFVSNKSIYKHLVPVNVNDSVLEVKPKSKSRRSKLPAKGHGKDPEPELKDYLEPTERLQHRIDFDDIESDEEHKLPTNRIIKARTEYLRLYDFYEKYLCPNAMKIECWACCSFDFHRHSTELISTDSWKVFVLHFSIGNWTKPFI